MNVEHEIRETTKKQFGKQCQLLANSEPTAAIKKMFSYMEQINQK